MRDQQEFYAHYKALEARMNERADKDGDAFLPNPEPQGPVEYILICMEPSLGRWARSIDEARSKVGSGFRNFLSHIDTMILQFCARQYLCKPGEHYHITDLSKGAMHVRRAGSSRRERYARYDRWYGLLKEEINLLARPDARIVAVGTVVREYLEYKRFEKPFTEVIHYSGLAGRARTEGIRGLEDRFAAFTDSVSLDTLIATTKDVFAAYRVPAVFREETLAHLAGAQLTTSRKKLMFNYKVSFESMRSGFVGSVDSHGLTIACS
jgi:hypothetical protein